MKIAVFSGTTEGRKLSEMLCSAGIDHHVFVATGYGSDIMDDDPHAHILVGRMDSDEMKACLSGLGFTEDDTIVDATHPYAKAVSENIRTAADHIGCNLLRVARSGSCDMGDVSEYEHMADFARFIDSAEGNILLTTGTNTLKEYCDTVSADTLERTYIRVLPSTESIDICHGLGISPGHIIAMQGPFSYDMNCAMIKQFDIRHMLTKDSGAAGGYNEKIKAAVDLGVACHVLMRPGDVPGVGAAQAYNILTGSTYKERRRIYIIGAGMGSADNMTLQAKNAVNAADAVFGSKRLLDVISAKRKYGMYIAKDIIAVLDADEDIHCVAVLYSGDTGFYSGAKDAYEEFRKWDENADITVIPGISSVSYLASKLCVNYDDAKIVSIHGRNDEDALERLMDTIEHSPKTFVLLSNDADIRSVAKLCMDRGINALIHIGRNLSYDDEEIVSLFAEAASEYKGSGVITALIDCQI